MADEVLTADEQAMQWGITEQGYVCPTEEQVLNEKIKRAKELFGEDISTNQTTVLGKMLRIMAKDEHRLYEEIEKMYYSATPSTATGISLDRALSFVFAKRNIPTYAIHTVKVVCDKAGYVVPQGTLFKSPTGVRFWAIEDTPIKDLEEHQAGASYYANTVRVQCTEAGSIGNVNTIDGLVLSNPNIAHVEYEETVSMGSDTESDPDARERYKKIVDGLGTNTKAAIIANVLKLNGVYDCNIIENVTDEPIEIGTRGTEGKQFLEVKPYTYAVIVYCTAQPNASDSQAPFMQDIAEAIFEKEPFGIQQSGNVEREIVETGKTNDEDVVHKIRFTLVATIRPKIVYTIETDDTYPTDGKQQIEKNIMDYVNSLKIGGTLQFTRLYGCIYSVRGVNAVTKLTVDGKTEDVPATKIEKLKCEEGDVVEELV